MQHFQEYFWTFRCSCSVLNVLHDQLVFLPPVRKTVFQGLVQPQSYMIGALLVASQEKQALPGTTGMGFHTDCAWTAWPWVSVLVPWDEEGKSSERREFHWDTQVVCQLCVSGNISQLWSPHSDKTDGHCGTLPFFLNSARNQRNCENTFTRFLCVLALTKIITFP